MTFDVKGMTCAACSAHVEKSVRKLEGVSDVAVSLLTNSMEVQFDPAAVTPDAICKAVASGGYSASPRGEAAAAAQKAERPDHTAELKAMRNRLIASFALLIALMYVAMGHMLHLPMPEALHRPMFNGLIQLLLVIPAIVINRGYFINGFKALFHLAPNMNSLICVGATAGLGYSLAVLLGVALKLDAGESVAMADYYFDASVMIPTLISVGKYLEAKAKGRTSEAISRLVDLAPRKANVIRDGVEVEIDASQLAVGDVVIVREGQTVPTDGVILEGHGSLDQSMLTGESVPVDLSVGDEVVGATINRGGSFTFRATKVGEDTALQKIVRLVEAAANSKAPISRLADRVSGVFVPVVMGIALVTFIVWLAIGGGVPAALKHAIAVLVISCPCALGLATPTAIMVGTGKGAELGIMIRSAASLEMAHSIDCVTFDKTGTLTQGQMRLTGINAGIDSDEALRLAAAVEKLSTHPIAAAIVAAARGRSAPGHRLRDPPRQGRGGHRRGPAHTGRQGRLDGRAGRGHRPDGRLGRRNGRLRRDGDVRRRGQPPAGGLRAGGHPAAHQRRGGFRPERTGRQNRDAHRRQRTRREGHRRPAGGQRGARPAAAPGQAGRDRRPAGPGQKGDDGGRRHQRRPGAGEGRPGRGRGPGHRRGHRERRRGADAGRPPPGRGRDPAGPGGDPQHQAEPVLGVLLQPDRHSHRRRGAERPGHRAEPDDRRRRHEHEQRVRGHQRPAAAPLPAGPAGRRPRRIGGRAQPVAVVHTELPTVDSIDNKTNIKEEQTMKKTVKIEGMMCQMCVKHVKTALSALDPNVEVSLENKCATVDEKVDDAAIAAAVKEAGYEVVA